MSDDVGSSLHVSVLVDTHSCNTSSLHTNYTIVLEGCCFVIMIVGGGGALVDYLLCCFIRFKCVW